MNVKLLKEINSNNVVNFVFNDEKNIYLDGEKIALLPLFSGKVAEISSYNINDKNILVVGLGDKEKFKIVSLKKSLKKAVEWFLSNNVSDIDVVLKNIDGFETEEIIDQIIHASIVGSYKFDKYMSKKEYSYLKSLNIIGDDLQDYSELVSEYVNVYKNSNFTRDLIVENSWTITPENFVKKIEEWAKKYPEVKLTILDKAGLEKEKMGLHLAVGNGGLTGPYMVAMEYVSDEKKSKIGLVGKGLCFDAGGYNLKPTNYIEDMKMDMGGAATVFGAFKSIVENGLKANVVCAVGLAENLIGKDAFRPGDVFIARNGKSVEIGNTDAEGRLVLADVLDYVQDNYKVEKLIDLATLTGAVTIALGLHYTGLFGNNDELKSDLMMASDGIDEQLWELPIDDDFDEMLKGKIADLSNISGHRYGGSSTAASFLKNFVKEDVQWAHLDIAGTAWIEKYDWSIYDKSVPTGLGVNLLYRFIKAN